MKKTPSNIYEANVPIATEQSRLKEFSWPTEVSIDLLGKPSKDTVFLDVGAGSNPAIGEFVRQAGAKYLALDKNDKFLKSQHEAGAEVMSGDIRKLPFEPETFDTCHVRFVLAHLGKDKGAAIKEVFRILKSPGRAIFMDYDWTKAHGSKVLGGIRDLFCESMLFDASFGSNLETVINLNLATEDARIEGHHYSLPKMFDYSQVLKLWGAALADLGLQNAAQSTLDRCNRLFDELQHEAASANPPGFYFPEIAAVIVYK